MNRIKRYIISTLHRWLGTDKLKEQVEQQRQAIARYEMCFNEHAYRIMAIGKLVNVGVDIHHPDPHHSRGGSWAVVCIQGKADYIQFISLQGDTMVEIKRFLQQFERANKTIDMPPLVPKSWFWEDFDKVKRRT